MRDFLIRASTTRPVLAFTIPFAVRDYLTAAFTIRQPCLLQASLTPLPIDYALVYRGDYHALALVGREYLMAVLDAVEEETGTIDRDAVIRGF